MCLKICSLSSGSKGNSVYVSAGNTKVLIDNGLSIAYTEKALAGIDVNPSELDAIIVTHRHSDHISGISGFSRKYNTKVYAYYTECDFLTGVEDNLFPKRSHAKSADKNLRHVPYDNVVDFFDGDFFLKDLTVSPFNVPHDVFCLGYSIYHKGRKVSIVTDLGRISDNTVKNISDSDVVMIESNHDEELLKNNVNYSPWLKKRIKGTGGHLSNNECANACVKLCEGGTRNIILAHLSEENNNPELAFAAVSDKLCENGIKEGIDVRLSVAKQHQLSPLFKVG